MPYAIRLFLLGAPAAFALASLVHGGVLVSGWEHNKAATAECVIATVMLLGLIAIWIWPARARGIAFPVMAFALLGTLVGAFTIVVGIGPKTAPDIAYRTMLIIGLAAALITIWRMRAHR